MLFDEQLFDAVCNALDIPPEDRGLLRQMVEADTQYRELRQQLNQEAWEHVQRAIDKELQRFMERLHALGVEGLHVELEEVDDA